MSDLAEGYNAQSKVSLTLGFKALHINSREQILDRVNNSRVKYDCA